MPLTRESDNRGKKKLYIYLLSKAFELLFENLKQNIYQSYVAVFISSIFGSILKITTSDDVKSYFYRFKKELNLGTALNFANEEVEVSDLFDSYFSIWLNSHVTNNHSMSAWLNLFHSQAEKS